MSKSKHYALGRTCTICRDPISDANKSGLCMKHREYRRGPSPVIPPREFLPFHRGERRE